MTDFVLLPFVIGYGGWWIDVDLGGDLQAWAPAKDCAGAPCSFPLT